MNPCPSARPGVARGWAAAGRGITRPQGREERAGLHDDAQAAAEDRGYPAGGRQACAPFPARGAEPHSSSKRDLPRRGSAGQNRPGGRTMKWPRTHALK
jgi:hypothetical protein